MKQKAFLVKLANKVIDTVFFDHNMTVYEVRNSLVNHDGYNPMIIVYERSY